MTTPATRGAASAPHRSPQNLSNFVWGIADQLRGVFKPNQYGTLVLPLTILRRMEAVMAPHREFFAELAAKGHPDFVLDNLVESRTGLTFYNLSPFTLDRILQEPDLLRTNLLAYVDGFSQNVADLFTYYEFDKTVAKLDEHDRLFLVLQQFASIDLSPDTVSNAEMGTLFEDLIRRFAAASNETAGEHFTPRDAVKLLVDLLTANDDDVLTGYPVRTVYDPTAGTGGMLSLLDERLRRMNPNAEVRLFGQELNDQSYRVQFGTRDRGGRIPVTYPDLGCAGLLEPVPGSRQPHRRPVDHGADPRPGQAPRTDEEIPGHLGAAARGNVRIRFHEDLVSLSGSTLRTTL